MSSLNLNIKKSLVRGDTKTMGKGFNIFLWTLQVSAAAMFIMAGASKLVGVEQMVKTFEIIGIGQWFRYFTGGIEILSAVLLLIPGLSGIGAFLLVGTMIGAVATHLFILGGSPLMAIILLVATAFIAWERKEQILELINKFITMK